MNYNKAMNLLLAAFLLLAGPAFAEDPSRNASADVTLAVLLADQGKKESIARRWRRQRFCF